MKTKLTIKVPSNFTNDNTSFFSPIRVSRGKEETNVEATQEKKLSFSPTSKQLLSSLFKELQCHNNLQFLKSEREKQRQQALEQIEKEEQEADKARFEAVRSSLYS